MRSVLITDCLQRDFVGPIGRFDALPNALHVGHEESLRLLGPAIDEGPVARTIAWAHAQTDEQLLVIHVRDWHDVDDANQKTHLDQFGLHCVHDTLGAEFVFRTDNLGLGKCAHVVNATGLSNFVGANLGDALHEFQKEPVRIGLMGVWTEAKITYLAYDLRARYPHCEIAVCSALTASSSRQNHFIALDQMERILGVRVLPSVGEFVDYLGGSMAEAPLIGFSHKHPELTVSDSTVLRDHDRQLVRYLFRGCREVRVKTLDGGFSGNTVLATASVDLHGHEQVPHVLKIGPRAEIGQERESFERIEAVLGNNAPRVADFADLADRGAIKYRYAAMGGGSAQSFQKLYESGLSLDEVAKCLDAVFVDQLGRLYRASEQERVDLLGYYQFSSRWTSSVREHVRNIIGDAVTNDVLEFPGGRRTPNIVGFYERSLDALPRPTRPTHVSQLHGDLNGANIIVDAQKNVWLIDFFHSHRGHVLKDLIKLENDVLYIYTKLSSEEDLEDALALTDWILALEDLGREVQLPSKGFKSEAMQRAALTVQLLRRYYPALVKADRDPLQLLVGQLRYAVHTLGFEENSSLQKRWALYTASSVAAQLRRRLSHSSQLRIDWLSKTEDGAGQIGLTWLPGRRDAGRSLDADIQTIQQSGIRAVICLLARDEFARYGVDGLVERYRAEGLEVLHLPTVDGRVPSDAELHHAVHWMESQLAQQRPILIHCVGGLGRAGTIAACWLKQQGYDSEAAIAKVRTVRSQRAVETAIQEEAIQRFDSAR